ncbi:hypothetical protein DFP72DRAFT_903760 [Ephemerocybe angulata]|uniref:CUE domain-containing protein n=1 Tax=Ephemerocybe angulata TaxID=980116 RepID=A0A8H6HUW9_9AGAR|nr:hypothetical protein DFP72DRAFT_903760 [Tulosesus angulatus]
MSEVVNVLVAFAVIIFLFRWVTSSNDGGTDEQRRAAAMLGFRPKRINSVSVMFPDIPTPNVHYDLLRTGNVELTTNRILERGFLEAPPGTFHTLYPSPATDAQGAHTNANASNSAAAATQAKPLVTKGPSLIEKYKLERRVQSGEVVAEEDVGGKAEWESSAEKREASLRERKAQMILAARQRFLAAQQKQAASS